MFYKKMARAAANDNTQTIEVPLESTNNPLLSDINTINQNTTSVKNTLSTWITSNWVQKIMALCMWLINNKWEPLAREITKWLPLADDFVTMLLGLLRPLILLTFAGWLALKCRYIWKNPCGPLKSVYVS